MGDAKKAAVACRFIFLVGLRLTQIVGQVAQGTLCQSGCYLLSCVFLKKASAVSACSQVILFFGVYNTPVILLCQ